MFKTDNHNNCNNYHPISLLHSISKIIEKLMHTHLTISLHKHNIKKGSLVFDIITPQHVHTKRSQKNIKQGSDSGKYACQRFLDFFFDTVKQDIHFKSHTTRVQGELPTTGC